jgi:hypothetical protein
MLVHIPIFFSFSTKVHFLFKTKSTVYIPSMMTLSLFEFIETFWKKNKGKSKKVCLRKKLSTILPGKYFLPNIKIVRVIQLKYHRVYSNVTFTFYSNHFFHLKINFNRSDSKFDGKNSGLFWTSRWKSLGIGNTALIRVARFKIIKMAKFDHKHFQKGQILKNEKKPNKGQISLKKLLK